MGEPPPTPHPQLDAAFDPSRLGRDAPADTSMPWQRPGVVAPDDHGRYAHKGFKARTILLGLAFILVPLLLLFVFVPRMYQLMGPSTLATIAVLLPVVLLVNTVTTRSRLAGRTYAPAWTWALIGAAMLAPPTLGLLGVINMQVARMAPTMVAAMAIPLAFPMRRRQGSELRCAKCDYPYPYTDPAGPPAPDACSECGNAWHTRGGLARGAKVRASPARIVLVIIAFFAISALSSFRGPLTTIMPTGSLISVVTARRAGFVTDEWAQLAKRPLTEPQRLRLARGLLDLRLAEQSLDRDGDTWLDAEILAGRLPQDLVDRYHREMYEAKVAAPPTVAPGEPFEVGLDTMQRGYSFGPRDVLIALDGFRIDGGPPAGRQDRLLHGNLAGVQSVWLGSVTSTPFAPRAQLTIDTPGEHTITCTYWVIIVPRGVQPTPITWSPDGTPSLPAGAYFAERREIQATINVTPPATPAQSDSPR